MPVMFEKTISSGMPRLGAPPEVAAVKYGREGDITADGTQVVKGYLSVEIFCAIVTSGDRVTGRATVVGPIISRGSAARLRFNHTSVSVWNRWNLVLIVDGDSTGRSRVASSKDRTNNVAIVKRGGDVASNSTKKTATIEVGIDGAIIQRTCNVTGVGGG